MSRRPWKIVVSSAILFAGLAIVLAPLRVPPVGSERWPSPRATLSAAPPLFPEGFGIRRVFVDAGHGAEGNRGNLSSFCEDEQDFTLRVSRHLAESLRATGKFEVRVSRSALPVAYLDRVREAQEWRAEAFLSIHSDVRGSAGYWTPRSRQLCPLSNTGAGFAVLYSDEGGGSLVDARMQLATRLAFQLEQAGFPAYDGSEYAGAYAAGGRAGVFLDRHAPDKRIFVLRRTAMPAILIETHNALHSKEALRWSEEQTLLAFDTAVAGALAVVLTTKGGLASRP